ncbi:hypothetical protein GMRT_16227 [Giardia muris]|uniref:Uncharacterized protein n=1 Tax=Giardia muris TaxID=5742 RepID=A0A4Z1SVP8_GIAMU|nr:hypothetical protein GMRT_16227 [Giardia muris]|eukprot:TNJ27658.1 hypothetical protein GMRT_16227 [Giardia muris]
MRAYIPTSVAHEEKSSWRGQVRGLLRRIYTPPVLMRSRGPSMTTTSREDSGTGDALGYFRSLFPLDPEAILEMKKGCRPIPSFIRLRRRIIEEDDNYHLAPSLLHWFREKNDTIARYSRYAPDIPFGPREIRLARLAATVDEVVDGLLHTTADFAETQLRLALAEESWTR